MGRATLRDPEVKDANPNPSGCGRCFGTTIVTVAFLAVVAYVLLPEATHSGIELAISALSSNATGTGASVSALAPQKPAHLVDPVVFDCAAVEPGKCYPPMGDDPTWGNVKLCDVPWDKGSASGSYYRWVPPFITGIARQEGRSAFAIDVGSNVGHFSIASAEFGLRVAAFEPVPGNVRLTSTMVCANSAEARSRFTLVPAAAGAVTVPGGISIFVPSRGDNAAMNGSAATANIGGNSTAVTVPVVAIDDWLAAEAPGTYDPADLVWFKADVQGYESFVLQGAKKTILAATNPGFRVTVEQDPKLYGRIAGAVPPSTILESWGFTSPFRTGEGDQVWVNPKYWVKK